MEELINLVVKTYGLVGFVLLAPYVALVYMWRQNVKLNADLVAYGEKLAMAKEGVTAAQAQRVVDAQQTATKMMELVSEQSGLNKETNITLDQLRELLMMMQTRRSSS